MKGKLSSLQQFTVCAGSSFNVPKAPLAAMIFHEAVSISSLIKICECIILTINFRLKTEFHETFIIRLKVGKVSEIYAYCVNII